MTTDGGQPARPGGLESLERIVQSCLENLRGSPHLADEDDARAFLTEVADHCRDAAPQGASVERVASSRHLTWPPDLAEADRQAIAVRLVVDTGIAGVDDGEIRFTDPTAQDYLAAHHLFRRYPRGPRWWSPRTRNLLAPRQIWPWPEAGTLVLLTALWRRDAPTAVDRRLRRLLHHRHRDPNLRFVVELVRRDLLPGSDLRDRTAAILREELADGSQDDAHWATMVECLRLLDPAMAAGELENVVRSPGPTVTPLRRVAAAAELLAHDPARGTENLRIVGDSLTGGPRDRLDAARRIAELDAAVGARTMRLLAHTREMGDLRTDAAHHEGSPAVLLELMAPAHALPDDGRLRLGTALLALDPTTGVEALERLARTASGPATPLRVAEVVEPHDRDLALRLADELAWPAHGTVGSMVRLHAVLLIGKFEPARAVPDLYRLATERSVTGEVRVLAATAVNRFGGSTTALVELSEDPNLDLGYRTEAAEAVGRVEPTTGARLLITLSATCSPTSAERPELLRRAYRLDRVLAAEEIVEFARDSRVDGRTRFDLIEFAADTLGRRLAVDLYSVIAADRDLYIAKKAARKVLTMDQYTGQRLMADIANHPGASSATRLEVAQEAGRHGRAILATLADSGHPDTVRLAAAKALFALDRQAGERALRKLAEASRTGDLRLDAALALPNAVDALVAIAGDRREKDTLRREAALKTRELDRRRGRKALADLSEARGISQSVRDKLSRDLDR